MNTLPLELRPDTLHIVHDIETLDTEPTAAIWQIGAVAYMEGKPYQAFDALIGFGSNKEWERTASESTERWWEGQLVSGPQRLVRNFYKAKDSLAVLPHVLATYRNFIAQTESDWACANTLVWGNGSDFDNVILAHAFKQCGIEVPWKYTHSRCLRTLRSLYPYCKAEFVGVKHDAFWDAQHEMDELQLILQQMRKEARSA